MPNRRDWNPIFATWQELFLQKLHLGFETPEVLDLWVWNLRNAFAHTSGWTGISFLFQKSFPVFRAWSEDGIERRGLGT